MNWRARTAGFFCFVIFSLVAAMSLVASLWVMGWTRTCLAFGVIAFALLLRGGFHLFLLEN